MSTKMIELDSVADIMGHDWTVEKVINTIQANELTAYVRIDCSTDNSDGGLDEKYELARIIELRNTKHVYPDGSEAFFIRYEPIANTDERDVKINLTEDSYGGAINYGRVYCQLKPESLSKTFLTTHEICIAYQDIISFISSSKSPETPPAKKMAQIRHKTAERDVYVDKIIKRINEELKHLKPNCTVINHIRFISEANIPESLFKSVAKQVPLQIRKYFNDCYKPLSRAPKKKIKEDYFLTG